MDDSFITMIGVCICAALGALFMVGFTCGRADGRDEACADVCDGVGMWSTDHARCICEPMENVEAEIPKETGNVR